MLGGGTHADRHEVDVAAEQVANLPITLRANAGSVSGRYDIVLVVQRNDDPAVTVEHATRFFAPVGQGR